MLFTANQLLRVWFGHLVSSPATFSYSRAERFHYDRSTRCENECRVVRQLLGAYFININYRLVVLGKLGLDKEYSTRGRHSKEVAFALLTQQPRVRFPAFPWNFHDEIFYDVA